MGFYDEGLYENVLRHRTSPATAIVFALTFDSSGNYLATATTTGILKIFSLPHVASASPSPSPSLTISAHDLSRYGSINSLESTETSLYVGTDCCLIRFSWESMVGVPDAQHRSTDKVEQFLATVQINTLGKLADGKKVVVGCGRGEFYLVEDGKGKLEPIGGPIGSAAYPHCIATMPNDPDIFLAGCDDGVIRVYDISQFKPIRREITLEEPTKEASKPYITSLAINNDASFALVADSSFRLSAIHIPSGSIVCSKDIPFLPQAVTFSDGMFYIGGSDRVKTDGSTQFSLMRCNVMCEQTGSAPVSATGVYAMAVSSTGSIAAAGYSASKFAKESFAEDVDVYWIPPVRSFSISV